MSRLFQKDFWKEIIESITSNGFRTIITGFGVAWGIFILILLLAASKGLENGVKKGFDGIATNSAFVWAQGISKAYKGLPEGREFTFNSKDTQAIKDNIKGLETVSPRNRTGGWNGGSLVTRDLNEGAFQVFGDYPEIITQMSLNMKQGRFLNYGDIEVNRKVCVIGVGVQNELYEKEETLLGTHIKVDGVNFKVIGVFNKPGASGDQKTEEESKIYIPFTTYLQAFNTGDEVGYYMITAKDGFSISDLKEDIFALLRKNHDIHPEDERAIGNFDLYEAYKQINGLFIALKGISFFVGFLILISGIIGISNIMLIVIKERTKEIGVRRALGATPGNIRMQILTESVFLTLFAGMTGISFAGLIVYIMNVLLDQFADPETMFANPSVSITTIGVALFLLVICGLLAGLIPAQTAIKIKPIEALRTE